MTPASREWPCVVCNVPGRTVANHGEPCDHCREAIADWDDPGIPTPSVHEILPPRYRDLTGFDRDQDEWAEKSPYSDWPRPRRIFPQADPGHPHSSCPSRAPSSSHKPDVASPVTSGRGEHLSDAA